MRKNNKVYSENNAKDVVGCRGKTKEKKRPQKPISSTSSTNRTLNELKINIPRLIDLGIMNMISGLPSITRTIFGASNKSLQELNYYFQNIRVSPLLLDRVKKEERRLPASGILATPLSSSIKWLSWERLSVKGET
jgi:hypothetical protein